MTFAACVKDDTMTDQRSDDTRSRLLLNDLEIGYSSGKII